MTDTPPSTSDLVHRTASGDREAAGHLMDRLYGELHALAAAAMRNERSGHTLQPTALVHEAFLRLVDIRRVAWKDGLHVRAMAAELMRRVLIDHARRQNAAKRGGSRERVTLTGLAGAAEGDELDLELLDVALGELDRLHPRHRRVVELRFFGGLTHREAAAVLGVSEQTVRLDWSMARAWLRERLSRENP